MPFQSCSCSRVLWAKLESIGAICMWRLNLLAPALAPCSRCSSVTTRSLLFLHDEDDNDVSSNNPLFFLYKDFLANIGFISWSKDQKRKKYWIAFFILWFQFQFIWENTKNQQKWLDGVHVFINPISRFSTISLWRNTSNFRFLWGNSTWYCQV